MSALDEILGEPAWNEQHFSNVMDRQLKLREHIFGKDTGTVHILHHGSVLCENVSGPFAAMNSKTEKFPKNVCPACLAKVK